MNPNDNAERSATSVARASGVRVTKRLASPLIAKRDVSQPAHETCALPRAASQSFPVNKAANACAPDRGVEVIMANHAPADEVQCNKWELFALLSFIVLSFAGLFFCFYVISAKCRGTWPF